MPRVLDGRRLTAKEHRIWKAVMESSGSGGAATNAVRVHRKMRRKRSGKQ